MSLCIMPASVRPWTKGITLKTKVKVGKSHDSRILRFLEHEVKRTLESLSQVFESG